MADMLEPVDSIPTFGEPTRADAVLASWGGRSPHAPYAADRDGLARSAAETARAVFPRPEVSRLLVEYGSRIGAPEESLENARRLADAGSLVVATGQQPVAAGGPLYTLYKAATAVRLAREAEALVGAPVVPVFWNASEDHDIDEVAVARAPASGGETLAFKADLEPWRGRPLHAVGADARWQAPAAEWLRAVMGDAAAPFEPRDGEGWSPWFSRILAQTLGGRGLVVLEPQILRPLAKELLARAATSWREIARLIDASCSERAERADGPGPPNFADLGGPPLFVEQDGQGGPRRRVLADGKQLVLKGTEARFEADELAGLALQEPERFSAHAALRPIVQNALLPVVAEVVGPGEIAYHEELFRFHLSELGAGRRPPVLWPRFSATALDRRCESALDRFGMELCDVFRPEAELVDMFTPEGKLAEEVRAASRSAGRNLAALEDRVLALDASLGRPLEKTGSTVARAFETFAGKVEAAEARLRGYAPEKLKRLAAWVRPGGRPQERVFSFLALCASAGEGLADRLVDEIDVFDHRHFALRLSEGRVVRTPVGPDLPGRPTKGASRHGG